MGRGSVVILGLVGIGAAVILGVGMYRISDNIGG